jgi:hypothetical protein
VGGAFRIALRLLAGIRGCRHRAVFGLRDSREWLRARALWGLPQGRVAFSCKGRGLCPSCGAKRAAQTAARLREEIFEPVGHAQSVFTVPKMLRPYSLRHRDRLD